MKLFKFKRRMGLSILLSLAILAGQALGLSNVTFPWNLNPSQIDYYWSTDARTPGTAGRSISSDPAHSYTISIPAKAAYTPPTYLYKFGAWDPPDDASQSFYLRVWDDGARSDGSHYTETFGPQTNLSGAPNDPIFNYNVFKYIKANAGQAAISSYVESKTVSNPTSAPTISGTITFNSAQPKVGTYEVQIKQTQWTIDGVTAATTQNMIKNASDFVTGTTYAIKVKHMSYWGSWGTDSDTLSYTSSGAPGGSTIFNIVLRRLAGGAGINSFSVPNSPCTVSNAKKGGIAATPTTTSISNALDLVNMINEIQGGACVRTFGYWNEVTQKAAGVVVQYSGSTVTNTTDLSGIALQKGRGYQVYVKPDMDTAVDITFDLQ